MQSAQQSSFEGEHQLAVLSEPTPYTSMVAFDVIAETRAELRELLQTLTSRMRLLYKGGLPQDDGPAVPADDNGILGPSVPSRSVAFIFGVGASLFDERSQRQPRPGPVPRRLQRPDLCQQRRHGRACLARHNNAHQGCDAAALAIGRLQKPSPTGWDAAQLDGLHGRDRQPEHIPIFGHAATCLGTSGWTGIGMDGRR